jgi:hypothetical protein
MKRGILTGLAALSLVGVVGTLALPASAQSWGYRGNRDRQAIHEDVRGLRSDNRAIGHDRAELRRDLSYGNYHAAREERRELRQDARARAVDRGDLRHDTHHF